MFKLKETIAVVGSCLLLAQGLPFVNLKGSGAEAATYDTAMQEIMSRSRPIVMGNQWHTTPEGTFSSGNTQAKLDFIGKHLDFISMNRAGGNMNDLFLDFYQSTHDPNRGLLKLRNDIYSAAGKYGRRVYVLPYHNMSDVWYYESVEKFTNENFWLKPDGQNIGTWDYMNKYNLWYRGSTDLIVPYPGYSRNTRRMWDSTKPMVQDYWVAHAKGITDQGFDGIFADNWLRSGFAGNNQAGIKTGWNEIGRKFKQAAPNKILIGNSPPDGAFTTRDALMLEDRINPDFDGDNSIPSYFSYSDRAESQNQVCLDTYWNEDRGDFKTFRFPMVLLTDNVLGISTVTKQGTRVESFLMDYLIKVGKIGYPKGKRYHANGVMQRDYSAGKVILNDTTSTVTVTLPSGVYRTIEGQAVSRISLGSTKGIVLKRVGGDDGSVTPPTPDPIPTPEPTPEPTPDPTPTPEPTPEPAPNTPAVPSNLAVDRLTAGLTSTNYYVNLKWQDNANNETGFEIYQSINSTDNFQLARTPGTNRVTYGTKIGPGPIKATYYFKIRAVNSNGKSVFSNIASVKIDLPVHVPNGDPTVVSQPQTPTAPSDMKIEKVTKGATSGNYYIYVAWADNSDDETGFEIYQSVNAGTYKLVKTPKANGTNYAINIGSNPTPGDYTYKIVAVNENGKSDPSISSSVRINMPNPPAAPANLTGITGISIGGSNMVVLTLTDNSNDEDGFNVYVSNTSGGTFSQVGSVSPNNTVVVIDPGTTGTYYYQVKSFNTGGESGATNTVNVTVN